MKKKVSSRADSVDAGSYWRMVKVSDELDELGKDDGLK